MHCTYYRYQARHGDSPCLATSGFTNYVARGGRCAKILIYIRFISIYMHLRVSDTCICVLMCFQRIFIRFTMNPLPDLCWALRVSNEFCARFMCRTLSFGRQTLKKHVLERMHVIFHKQSMFEHMLSIYHGFISVHTIPREPHPIFSKVSLNL